jgi:Transglycosylase SLT domain
MPSSGVSLPVDSTLLALARDAAAQNGLDAAVVCAVIEQESGWESHAMRYEGAFRAKYVSPLGLSPTEEIARSISWGLMQVMGQVAREHGFAGKFLCALCEPAAGVTMGCVVLAAKIALAERELAAEISKPGAFATPCLAACKTATLGCMSIGAVGCGDRGAGIVDRSSRLNVYRRALQLWNGGANAGYADQVLGRVAKYQ